MKEPFGISSEHQGDWAENIQSLYFRSKSQLKRYWWVVLFTTALALAYQLYEDSRREPTWDSRAQMKLDGGKFDGAINGYRDVYNNYFGTQIELMTSKPIYERAVKRVAAMYPQLRPATVIISANLKPKTNIFVLRASATGRAEEQVGKYVEVMLNAVMEEYQNYGQEEVAKKARQTMLAITEELSMVNKKLLQDEDAIVEYLRQNSVSDLQQGAAVTSSFLNQLKGRLSELRLKQRQLNSLSLEEHLKGRQVEGAESTDMLAVEVLEVSRNYQTSKQAYDELLAQRDEFASYLKPRHPKMMRFNREIERLQNRLVILRQQALEELQSQQRSLQGDIFNLEQAIADEEVEALDRSRRLADYDRLVNQRNRSRQLYDKLVGSIENIDMSKRLQVENVSIYQPASPATENAGNRLDSVAKGFAYGFIAGGVLLFLIGSLDRRVISTEDLKNNFDDPVLGIIPKQTGVDPNSITFMEEKGKRHIFGEAFRTLRSSILFMGQTEPRPNTFIITSAVPEEGKSTIASNLAISLAVASSRTLLVDADLRRGRLNRLFKIPNRNGLIEVLQGKLTLDDAILNTEIENLHFIPRGQTVSNSGELLLSETMQDIIKRVKSEYDYVILATDDTTSFASKVDAILYVVRSTTIRLRQVKVAVDNLKMRSANIAGFIMNFADTRGMDYYYYNKYQYYYRYQSQDVVTKK